MEAECVFEYDNSNAKADSLSCLIVESKYVFTRFKMLKDISEHRQMLLACDMWKHYSHS
jgi:hypothetical protein